MRTHALLMTLLTPLAFAACTETEEVPGQCLAYPTCPDGFAEVDACPADAECQEATVCGSTILCAPEPAACLAVPVCPEGYARVDECPQDDVDCQQVTACGQTIQCLGGGVECLAVPVCPEGYEQVDQCPQDDVDCRLITECGVTIECLGPMVECQAYPVCPADTVPVDECPQDARCEPVTVCGYTVQCMEAQCLPELDCPAGLLPVEACTTDQCQVVERCGYVQACDIVCDGPEPVCPEGWTRSARCDVGDPNCQRVDDCSGSVWCVPAERCVGAPECPEGVTSAECGGQAACEQRVMCGAVYYCIDLEVQACDPPVCPEGMRPIDGCPPEHPDCERVTAPCGLTQDCIVDMDCDQAVECPEGTERVDRCVDDGATRCEWVVDCGTALLCSGPR